MSLFEQNNGRALQLEPAGLFGGSLPAVRREMVGVRVANASTPIEGHFFSVISNTNEVILSIEPIFASNSPDERIPCTIRLHRPDGVHVHSRPVSELHGITMGQRVGTDADGTARYHFCLLYSGSMPMLLSTHTDDERREVRAVQNKKD